MLDTHSDRMVGCTRNLVTNCDIHRLALSSAIWRHSSGLLQSQPVPSSEPHVLSTRNRFLQDRIVLLFWKFRVDVARIRISPVLVPCRFLFTRSSQVFDDSLPVTWHSPLHAYG
jgi:hypothetical protein